MAYLGPGFLRGIYYRTWSLERHSHTYLVIVALQINDEKVTASNTLASFEQLQQLPTRHTPSWRIPWGWVLCISGQGALATWPLCRCHNSADRCWVWLSQWCLWQVCEKSIKETFDTRSNSEHDCNDAAWLQRRILGLLKATVKISDKTGPRIMGILQIVILALLAVFLSRLSAARRASAESRMRCCNIASQDGIYMSFNPLLNN